MCNSRNQPFRVCSEMVRGAGRAGLYLGMGDFNPAKRRDSSPVQADWMTT